METIIWTDDFSVGVTKIDSQHKRLVAMINRLIEEPGTTTNSETVSDLLTDMTNYAQVHFATEEQLMQQHNYPNIEEQFVQHRAFRKKTVDFCTATMLEAGTVPETMLNYLREWLVDHILNIDMKYKTFFHECGVE